MDWWGNGDGLVKRARWHESGLVGVSGVRSHTDMCGGELVCGQKHMHSAWRRTATLAAAAAQCNAQHVGCERLSSSVCHSRTSSSTANRRDCGAMPAVRHTGCGVRWCSGAAPASACSCTAVEAGGREGNKQVGVVVCSGYTLEACSCQGR